MLSAFDGLAFCGSLLDRADHLRRDPAAIEALRMLPGARFLILSDLKPFLRQDGTALYWARRSEVPEGPMIFLGLDAEGSPHFAVDGAPFDDLAGKLVDGPAAASLPAESSAVVAQARSLLDWHRRHGFCANCGAPTRLAKAGYSRLCEACATEHFPRVDPVVIMLAEHQGKVLVGRGAAFPPGFYSALAGFVEPGESLEEAVARELHEEAGVRATNVRMIASQPWPFPASLMIGAHAEALGTELQLDETEIADAMWVSRAEVRQALSGEAAWTAPPPIAIAHHLLRHWVQQPG